MSFQFLSCTGATTEDVLSHGGGCREGGGEEPQIDAFNAPRAADFALLSLGGNDLGFFRVMNACVFRFYSSYSGARFGERLELVLAANAEIRRAVGSVNARFARDRVLFVELRQRARRPPGSARRASPSRLSGQANWGELALCYMAYGES